MKMYGAPKATGGGKTFAFTRKDICVPTQNLCELGQTLPV